MKKTAFLLIASLAFVNFVFAQHEVKFSKGGLTFKTPELCEKYDTKMKHFYGWMGDNYAINISTVPLKDESDEFKSDIKLAALEVANDHDYKDLVKGGPLPNIVNGFYCVGKSFNEDGTSYPVVVAVIWDTLKDSAYEITIQCYNQDLQKGIAIAESFKW